MYGLSYEEKKSRLLASLRELCRRDTLLAFSGGVDSALLLSLLKEYSDANGTKVVPVIISSDLQPIEDVSIAENFCRSLGLKLEVITVTQLTDPVLSMNPKNRCYLCKHNLFSKLISFGKTMGIQQVLDGTNLDDTKVYRPGLKALTELGVISPLKEAGFTKAEVRKFAEERNLSVAKRPSTPCLATRFPYDTKLTAYALKKAGRAESCLKKFDLYNVRVRTHGALARIECDLESFPTIMKNRLEITRRLHALGYTYVTLDLDGFRSGSFDV